ncbi:hypothetical protein EGW08_001085 [Elysia chlorotica]|uniref:TIR domain-containing protein n=1 Tax=Elysia chlorotica TaxID=188477 RepID=A0A433UBN6_ELYCH|nr:hypothetical protein EGW08_001085 [Elysia chlorotica]
MGKSLVALPGHLPPSISNLDVDNNAIAHFESSVLSRYTTLLTLNAPRNKISELRHDGCQSALSIRHLDLSFNNISTLENGALACMPNLTQLILRGNNIEMLTGQTLAGLSKLELLDLAINKILTIQPGAFLYCQELVQLDLSHNKKLSLSRRYVETFTPLTKLEVLNIQGCTTLGGRYPTEVLSVLPALQELWVNGEKYPFDCKLQSLKNLTRLNLGTTNFCWTKNFTSSYFCGLPHLKSIKIEGCDAKEYSVSMFDANPNLEEFELFLEINIVNNLLPVLCYLPDLSKLKSVTIANLKKHKKLSPLISLQQKDAVCLGKMVNLVSLNLDYNDISQVGRDFSLLLPKSLRAFSLRGNLLISFQSLLYEIRSSPHIFPSLKSVYEDDQGLKPIWKTNTSPILELSQSPERHSRRRDSVEHQTDNALDLTSKTAQKNLLARLNDPTGSSDSMNQASLVDKDPIFLDFYSASHSMNLGVFSFKKANTLQFRVLNVSNTFITDWGEYPVRYMPEWTVIADLSENKCERFKETFFVVNNSLIELHAHGNFLGPMLSQDVSGDKLSRLTRLEYLDLSRNHLFYLPRLLFTGLSRLQVLKLSSNNIESLDIHIGHMKSLLFIDLTKNSISYISTRTRDELDTLSANRTIFVDLNYNPLPCTCNGFELLEWMSLTRVRIMNKDLLVCRNGDSRLELVGDLSQRVLALQRECISKRLLIVVSSFSCAVLLLVAGFVWVFQKRWWILYMWNLTVSKFYGYKTSGSPRHRAELGDPASPPDPRFTFDAFFVYTASSSDFVLDECLQELEQNRGHRLCVEDRDFLPGSYVPCNMTSAVRSSRRTVLVLDRGFRPAGWTHYAVEMAQVEAARTSRDVLHLLVVGAPPDGPLAEPYLTALRRGRFSEVPPRECRPDVRAKFWDRLSHTLGHGGRGRDRLQPHLVLSD